MTFRATASSKINRWAAQAQALGFEVNNLDDDSMLSDRWDYEAIEVRAPFGYYVIAAFRFVGADGNRAKAFRHSVSRRAVARNYMSGESQTLQTREVAYYFGLDRADADDAGL